LAQTRPIRLVVVTVAGGLMDVAARVTADHVGKAIRDIKHALISVKLRL
jgi:tripartite-type tricarboxylate transporter receptor subunit TctC